MSEANVDKNRIVLGYWAIQGLAEPSRLVLHYTNTPFTDKFYVQGDGPEYSREEWFSEKEKLDLDFPNLPYLFDGDLKITQSKAILYYLGRKFNLMGKTLEDEAKVMMLCEQAHDLRIGLASVCYGPAAESDEVRQQFLETNVNEFLARFDKYRGKHNTKFAVGDQPTVADFQLFSYIHSCSLLDGASAVFDKYENVKPYLTTVTALPEIKDYIIQSQAQLPINNKVAKFGGTIISRK